MMPIVPKRHAHALEFEAVGPRPLGEHGADGIGQPSDLFEAFRNRRRCAFRRAAGGRRTPPDGRQPLRPRRPCIGFKNSGVALRRAFAAAFSAVFFSSGVAMREPTAARPWRASPMPRISVGGIVLRCAPVCSSLNFLASAMSSRWMSVAAPFVAENRGDLARSSCP